MGAEKIGEGRFRNVYAASDVVLKSLKPWSRKLYGPIPVPMPTTAYTTLKYGIPDFNEHEFMFYRHLLSSIPESLAPHFAHIRTVRHLMGTSISVCDIVKDAEGDVSRNLEAYGSVRDPYFWEQFDAVVDFLRTTDDKYLDMKGRNILVQHRGDGHAIPVLCDYKRMGTRTYPFQPALHLDTMQEQMMMRRAARVKDTYQPSSSL